MIFEDSSQAGYVYHCMNRGYLVGKQQQSLLVTSRVLARVVSWQLAKQHSYSQAGWGRIEMKPNKATKKEGRKVKVTPSVLIYMYQVCPKSNLTKFDQIYKKKINNIYNTKFVIESTMKYMLIVHMLGSIVVAIFFSIDLVKIS